MRRKKTDYVVQSVVKALEAIEALAAEDRDQDAAELGRRLDVSKRTVARILHTLEGRGYVEPSGHEDGRYRVGLRAFEMGQAYRHQLGLFQASRTVLRELASRCDESASLAVLRGTNVVYLDVVQTSKQVRLASRVGSIAPAHCTAAGKIQLAFLGPEAREAFFRRATLAPLTDHTVTDAAALRGQMAEAASRGWASDDQEFEVGVRCVGVPVFDHHGKAIAGVSLSAPLSRMPENRLESELLPLLLEAGREISRRLGFDPDRPRHE